MKVIKIFTKLNDLNLSKYFNLLKLTFTWSTVFSSLLLITSWIYMKRNELFIIIIIINWSDFVLDIAFFFYFPLVVFLLFSFMRNNNLSVNCSNIWQKIVLIEWQSINFQSISMFKLFSYLRFPQYTCMRLYGDLFVLNIWEIKLKSFYFTQILTHKHTNSYLAIVPMKWILYFEGQVVRSSYLFICF